MLYSKRADTFCQLLVKRCIFSERSIFWAILKRFEQPVSLAFFKKDCYLKSVITEQHADV